METFSETKWLPQNKIPLLFIDFEVVFPGGLDNLRGMRGTPVSLKSTLVSLNSTRVSLNSSQVSLTVSIYVGGCSCLACFVYASHVCLANCIRSFPGLDTEFSDFSMTLKKIC